jgi:transcriptional regulator with XRE-family HTH domain
MSNPDWKERLKAAIENSGKSMREISLSSGHGPGYLHSVFTEGKDPKITTLMKVCDAAGVSLLFILHGMEVAQEDEELLKELYLHPAKREAIRKLLATD